MGGLRDKMENRGDDHRRPKNSENSPDEPRQHISARRASFSHAPTFFAPAVAEQANLRATLAAGLFADDGSEVAIELFLIDGDVTDAAEGVAGAVQKVSALFGFTDNFGKLVFGGGNARTGRIVIVLCFNPVLDAG